MQYSSHTAKHVFLYLLAFFTLGFTAIAFGQILFQIINHIFPETTASYSGDFKSGILRFGISALIVAGPVYYFTTRQINRELEKGEMKRNAGVRRWLTYFLLFIAGAVIIGDLIAVLNSFFEGELTVKFFLKVFAIFAIASGFGSYYFFDLKRENLTRDSKIKTFAIIFWVVFAVVLSSAFLLVDSPWKMKSLREDRERINELRNLTFKIKEFYLDENRMPRDLDELVTEFRVDEKEIEDPMTSKKYDYRILNKNDYKLCADFAFSTDEDIERKRWNVPEWRHDAGKRCFEITIGEIAGKEVLINHDRVKPLR